jgi:hypothetical protein
MMWIEENGEYDISTNQGTISIIGENDSSTNNIIIM